MSLANIGKCSAYIWMWWLANVVHQLLNGDDFEIVLLGKLLAVGQSLHESVFVSYKFTDHSGRLEPGELRELHGGFGMASSFFEKARHRSQRKNVARLYKIFRFGLGVGQQAHRQRSVVGRDSRGGSVGIVTGDGIGSSMTVGLIFQHWVQLKLVGTLSG